MDGKARATQDAEAEFTCVNAHFTLTFPWYPLEVNAVFASAIIFAEVIFVLDFQLYHQLINGLKHFTVRRVQKWQCGKFKLLKYRS